jgi:hypothetical protein
MMTAQSKSAHRVAMIGQKSGFEVFSRCDIRGGGLGAGRRIQFGAADADETPINSGLGSKGAAERERLARLRARRLRAAIGAP